MNLKEIRGGLVSHFEAKTSAREKALPLCRQVVRVSANAIRAIHRAEKDEAEKLMEQAASLLGEANDAMSKHPDVRHAGFYHDAAKEYAESRITHALVFSLPLPTPEELGVEPPAYLNGMGEAVGEMRRHILDLMRHGELQRSEELLDAMDEIFYLLIAMDYPDAITGGLRRTTDVARSIMERTRGDLSTTLIQYKLKTALDEARKDIEQS